MKLTQNKNHLKCSFIEENQIKTNTNQASKQNSYALKHSLYLLNKYLRVYFTKSKNTVRYLRKNTELTI